MPEVVQEDKSNRDSEDESTASEDWIAGPMRYMHSLWHRTTVNTFTC
jgi:hypothetical protein